MKTLLLGSIRKIPRHELSKKNVNKQIEQKVQAPYEWPKGVTHHACTQCGTVKEIDLKHAQKLLPLAKKSATLIDEISRYYFTVSFCSYCREKPVKVNLVERKKTQNETTH
ncbi:hypothetical protein CVU83_03570 [Candidatus Falkowbacteria bacterium HGW-Falkowbacteria-2]|uniref:Uncharacterized protein n=1 Tax=Candidatus Falkowbacteria bacterium HGW-Falkowbacteria-2 TaxID=2013769 RepID=A0A2N2DWY4_9BACT|nr:MAG: hypothetical protein CVU83_03570 [Candidatus Falkowbacteria bacterium HGW-Falkowbacteria-2]